MLCTVGAVEPPKDPLGLGYTTCNSLRVRMSRPWNLKCEDRMKHYQTKTKLVVIALGAVLSLAGTRILAAEDFDLDKAIATAKTPADHEAIAAYFDKEAAEAQAKADNHAKMEDAYKKLGTALVEKQHLDQHCDRLSAAYAQAAKENRALAKAHRDMAKKSGNDGT
jgi:hypothetical protein